MEISERDKETHLTTHKLPTWVKCSKCGGKPTETDWLVEIVPNSNALIHMSCAAKS